MICRICWRYIICLKIICHTKRTHDFVYKDDLSYKKDASQSHTVLGPGYGAENVVDGNTATCMRTEAIGPNSPYKTVWWKVDLGGVYNIYSVNILFKNYDGYGMYWNVHCWITSHKMCRERWNLLELTTPTLWTSFSNIFSVKVLVSLLSC